MRTAAISSTVPYAWMSVRFGLTRALELNRARNIVPVSVTVQYHYPYSLNKAPALKNKIKRVKLLNSENWAKECLSLPLYPYMKLKDANKVVNLIRKFYS